MNCFRNHIQCFVLGLFVALCCTSTGKVSAQDLINDGVTVQDELIRINKRKQLAKDFFEIGNYPQAVNYGKQYFEFNSKHWKTAWIIAESSYHLRDYEAATQWFEKYIEIAPEVDPKSTFFLGVSQKSLGNYNEAIRFLEAFKELNEASDERLMKQVEVEMEGCRLGIAQRKTEREDLFVGNVGKSINGSFAEANPVVLEGTGLFFISQKGGLEQNVTHNLTTVYGFTSHMVNIDTNEPTSVSGFDIDSNLILTGVTFSENLETGFCSYCSELLPISPACRIYKFKFDSGTASEVVALDSSFNLVTATQKHPALGVDVNGNKVLYFSSNREGGQGNEDIWFALLNEDGTPGVVKNAGPMVNSPWSEVSPFYDRWAGKLWFSSNGHPSIGGFDIFSSKQEESLEWSEPVNVGIPINSSLDDLFFSKQPSKQGAHFVSNRPSGYSPKRNTCCDDIYEVKYPSFTRHVAGEIWEDLGFTERRMKNYEADLFLVSKDSLVNITSHRKKNHFVNLVESREDHYLMLSKKGFKSKRVELPLYRLEQEDTLRLGEIKMKRESFGKGTVLASIPYDFESPSCDPSIMNRLDTIMSYLYTFKDLNLVVSGYSDLGETEEKKQQTAKKGAEDVVAFLLKQNVSDERLSATGNGVRQKQPASDRIDFVVQ